MVASFRASDAEGAWDWKTAYDACEAAQILFLRKFGPAMRERAASPSRFLAMLTKLAALLPSHTRRSEESQALPQFSTPIGLGFVATAAAAITPADVVLEPSAGTGLLAVHAELAGGSLVLNEIADTRADGARLVAITGACLSPDNPSWRDGFVRLQERCRVVFSAAVDGRVYARHGTTTETRLTVIDRVPADDPTAFPASPGLAGDTATLLDWVTRLVPPRAALAVPPTTARATTPVTRKTLRPGPVPNARSQCISAANNIEPVGVELTYETVDWKP